MGPVAVAAGLAVAIGFGAGAGVSVAIARGEIAASPTLSETPASSPGPSTIGPVTAGSAVPSPEPDTVVSVLPDPPIDDVESTWVVVNKSRPLDPLQWVPPDLVALSSLPGGSGERMRAEAASALVAMHAAAADAGVPFAVTSAYRSYDEQVSLHAGYVAARGRASAERFSARAGYSEHQLGLAVDVYASAACELKPCFADEPAGQWVAAHAHEFGFIVRYPLGYYDTVGYIYEPWHLRYLGPELAADVHASGAATLEEYFGLPGAPDYP